MDPLLTEIEPAVAEGDEEQSGAYYRCRDDIEHFRVKVRVSLSIWATCVPSFVKCFFIFLVQVRKVVAASNFSVTTTEEDEEPSSPASSSVNAQWIANVTLGWQEKLYSQEEENYYLKAKEEDFQVLENPKRVMELQ